jgi:hypothetical protein
MSAEGAGLVPDDHADRIRWNAKYGTGFAPSFRPHPLAARTRPALPPEWCLAPGEPASLLPSEFSVLDQSEIPGRDRRRLLARRAR